MAKILFHMFGEPGHTTPTLKLAKGLVARGHTVTYHALVDFEAQLKAEGLGVLPFLEERFPKGSLTTEELPRLAARRKIVTEYLAELDGVAPAGPVERQLRELAPDLVIVDAMQVAYALLLRRLGMPLLVFTTSLPQTMDEGVPPLTSGAKYRSGFSGRAVARLAWGKHLVRRRAIDAASRTIGLPTRAALVRAGVARFGMDASVLDQATAFLPQLRGAAELVACPPAFDFPRPPRPGRGYTESVDLSRHESVPMPELTGDGPLVFCSMGTQAHRTPGVSAFLRRVVAALGRERGIVGLVVHGGAELGPPLPNVTYVARAPQLAVLKRASLMITHGGLGSVKECIANAVPMNVYPLKDDQPGNGARVELHGLGRAGRTREATAASIARMMRETLDGGALGTKAMQTELLRFEAEGRGVQAVEAALASASVASSNVR